MANVVIFQKGRFEMVGFSNHDECEAMSWISLWSEVGGEDTLETFVRDIMLEPSGVASAIFAHADMLVARNRDDIQLAVLAEALSDEIEHRHFLATN